MQVKYRIFEIKQKDKNVRGDYGGWKTVITYKQCEPDWGLSDTAYDTEEDAVQAISKHIQKGQSFTIVKTYFKHWLD